MNLSLEDINASVRPLETSFTRRHRNFGKHVTVADLSTQVVSYWIESSQPEGGISHTSPLRAINMIVIDRKISMRMVREVVLSAPKR